MIPLLLTAILVAPVPAEIPVLGQDRRPGSPSIAPPATRPSDPAERDWARNVLLKLLDRPEVASALRAERARSATSRPVEPPEPTEPAALAEALLESIPLLSAKPEEPRPSIRELRVGLADFKIKLPAITVVMGRMHDTDQLSADETELYRRLLHDAAENLLRSLLGGPSTQAATKAAEPASHQERLRAAIVAAAEAREANPSERQRVRRVLLGLLRRSQFAEAMAPDPRRQRPGSRPAEQSQPYNADALAEELMQAMPNLLAPPPEPRLSVRDLQAIVQDFNVDLPLATVAAGRLYEARLLGAEESELYRRMLEDAAGRLAPFLTGDSTTRPTTRPGFPADSAVDR